jgi:hypothetical protein
LNTVIGGIMSLLISAVVFIVLVHIAVRPLDAKLDRIIELLKHSSNRPVA